MSRKAQRQANKANRQARRDQRQAKKATRRDNRQERRLTRATRGDRRRDAKAARQAQRQAARAERGPMFKGLGEGLAGLAGTLLGGGGAADPYDDAFLDPYGDGRSQDQFELAASDEKPWYVHPVAIAGGVAAVGTIIYVATR